MKFILKLITVQAIAAGITGCSEIQDAAQRGRDKKEVFAPQIESIVIKASGGATHSL